MDKRAIFEKTEKNLLGMQKRKGMSRRPQKRSKNADAIKEMNETLSTKPKFTKLVEYSVECLKKMAVDETSVEEIIEEGTIEALLKVLRLNPFNEAITDLVNTTLLKFCKNDEIRKTIGKKMGGGVFVNSLKKHKDPNTILNTCKVVAELAVSPETCDQFVADGMIEALAQTIKDNPDNEDIIQYASAALDKIAGHKNYADRVMKTGCVDNVLQALKMYPDNAALDLATVGLIGKLASTSDQIVENLKKAGAVDIIVAALELHPDDEPLLEAGAYALSALAGAEDIDSVLKLKTGINNMTASAMSKLASLVLVDDNVDYMIQNQGIEWLLAALRQATGDHSPVASKILSAGCRALQRICLDEHKIYAVMQKGGVKVLTNIMAEHKDDEAVAATSLGALAKTITRKENAVFVAKAGGIKGAVDICDAHPESEKVAKSALDFFQRMAAHDVTVPSLVDAGAIKSVVDLLGGNVDNPELVSSAINSLGRMATNEANVKKIVDAGGLNNLMEAMNAQMDNLDPTKQTMLMVETCALVPENQARLRDLGAVDSILKALECHPEDDEIQQIAARTLALIGGEKHVTDSVANLQKYANEMKKGGDNVGKWTDKFNNGLGLVSDLSVVDANKPIIARAGGVRALIDAFEAIGNMPEGPKKQNAYLNAARAMLRLASDPEAAKQIISMGGLAKVVMAAINNPDNEELAEAAMDLIALLSADEANVQPMLDAGVLDQIVQLCKANPDNARLFAAACRALGNLCINDDVARAIIRAGGAQIVVDSLNMNMNDPDAVLNALQTICKLAVDDECVRALVAAGAIDAILKALKRYGDNPEIVGACVQALCQLCIDEEIAQEIGDKGGNPLLVKAMRDHYQNEPICEVDMVLLDSLASVPENAERLLEEELQTCDLVKWIMESYAENTPLNEAGQRLLDQLLGPAVEEGMDDSVILDALSAEQMLANLARGDLTQAQLLGMLQNLAAVCGNPANAKLLVKQGGLQQLAAIMKANADNEPVFYAAAAAFANMADNAGDEAVEVLEDPALLEALSSMIKPHDNFAEPMNLNDLTKAVGCGSKLKMKPAVVEELIKNQPFEALLNMLNESDDDLLLQNAARLLGKVSNDDDAAELLAGITNLRELIAAMRRNFQNQEFLKFGVYLLGNLALSDELKNKIGIEGGVQLIMQIMETYPNNEGLIENCCYTLANLSFENQINNSFIVACSGIQHLLTAMQLHSQSEDLLESAVCVLCNLCHNNDTNKELIVKNGGAQAIVETVLNNFNSLELVMTAFRTLGNLAYNPAAIGEVMNAGAVQGIVAGMTVHSSELDVIDIALKVLSNLATDLSKETQNIMAQEGAVQAVVEVCGQYHDNLELELTILGCLGGLVREPSNAEVMIKQGGAEAALSTMASLSFDTELVAKAVFVLSQMSLSVNNLERVFNAGTVEGIIKALKEHPNEHDIVVQGMSAIGNLSYSAETADKLASLGIINQVVSTIDANANEAPILSACYQALSGLCRSEANAVSMAEMTMTRLVKNFLSHANNEVFLGYGFSYLGNLCVTTKAGESVLTTGMVPATVRAIDGITSNPHLMMRGLRALEHTAFAPMPVREHMKSEGVIETCERWSAASSRDDVKASCAAVIAAINRVDSTFVSLPFVTFNKPTTTTSKSARNIFGDVEVTNKVPELSEATRNYLQAGKLLTKHSNTAAPRPRHVYVTTDLKFLVWKDPKSKGPIEEKQKMKIFKIKAVEAGRCTPQLNRKRFGKFLASEECSFGVLGRNRTVDLEADSEATRDKWIKCILELVEWTKATKAAAKSFGAQADGR